MPDTVSGWDEARGRVSQAFDDWKLIDRDQRAFLRLGLEFAAIEYDRRWSEAGREPSWDGGPEHLDTFEVNVHGLWENDYAWMHLSGVIRDAVSNFEVYLEKAREEVLVHQGQPRPAEARAPNWHTLKAFFSQLSVTIATSEVSRVRDLRHLLTHRRGELRTEELRRRFQAGDSDSIPAVAVELTKERVLYAMDQLGIAVRQIDSTVYAYTWGRASVRNLKP